MPTADATLLPPAYLMTDPAPTDRALTGPAEERGSARHLEDVGVHAVLGAMIEQKRRASQPSFSAIDLPPRAHAATAASGEDGSETDAPESEAPASSEPGEPRRRTPTRSEVFLKAR